MYNIEKRKITSFPVNGDEKILKEKMLDWCNRFSIFSFLDSCGYKDQYSSFDCIAAAGAEKKISGTLSQIKHVLEEHHDWLFGHISYDAVHSTYGKKLQEEFECIFFFQPEVVFILKDKTLSIETINREPEEVFREILLQESINLKPENNEKIKIRSNIEKEEYISIIHQLRKHIQRGDCYEINFCLRFFAENYLINPVHVFKKLIQESPNPFSCFYKNEHRYLLCASPERFLKKDEQRIITQPIKGTARRNLNDASIDILQKKSLFESQKERSENVMAVDLARNDLSRICEEGSVHVSELYGIYTFPQVYQMISTVQGKLPPHISLATIIDATFPMASMTGAPKKKVMELIEQYEKTDRGIFSGTVGYISPKKDFDFNVVIRSIIYNDETKFLSFPVGGGITWLCDPEKEWEECLLKSMAIRKILENQS